MGDDQLGESGSVDLLIGWSSPWNRPSAFMNPGFRFACACCGARLRPWAPIPEPAFAADPQTLAYYDRRAGEYGEWYIGAGMFARRDRPG